MGCPGSGTRSWSVEPVLAYGRCAPSGWLALDLDSVTADPARLADDTLVEAVDRVRPDRFVGGGAAGAAARRAGPAAARRQGAVLGRGRRVWAASTPPTRSGWRCACPAAPRGARIGLARLAAVDAARGRMRCGSPGGSTPPRPARSTTPPWCCPTRSPGRSEARVLPRAPGQTLAQLKAALARAVIAVDPEGAEARHRQARRDRRVVLTAEAGRDGHPVGDAHRHRRRRRLHVADPAGPRSGF